MERRLLFETERGILDFSGDGECCEATGFLLTVSGVKLTCFADLEVTGLCGVVGRDESVFSRPSLLGLLFRDAIEDGLIVGFFILELACLSMDLTRSNLPGLRRKLLGSDFGATLTLLVVADFARPWGVPLKCFFKADFDEEGI